MSPNATTISKVEMWWQVLENGRGVEDLNWTLMVKRLSSEAPSC
jgi:hypothetical protein